MTRLKVRANDRLILRCFSCWTTTPQCWILNSLNSSVIVILHGWPEVCNIIYGRLVEWQKCYSQPTLQCLTLKKCIMCAAQRRRVCVRICAFVVSPLYVMEFGCLTVADVWKSEQLRRSPGQRLMFQLVEGTLSLGNPTVHLRLHSVYCSFWQWVSCWSRE